jgi:hypothetical protein
MCVSGFLTGALNCALQALHTIIPGSAGNITTMFLSDQQATDIHITHTAHTCTCPAVVTVSRPTASWCAGFTHAMVASSPMLKSFYRTCDPAQCGRLFSVYIDGVHIWRSGAQEAQGAHG